MLSDSDFLQERDGSGKFGEMLEFYNELTRVNGFGGSGGGGSGSCAGVPLSALGQRTDNGVRKLVKLIGTGI